MPAKMTPLIEQYTQIKAKQKDCLLLFQLGDFYELFYEDAKKASAILSLTLTQRQGIPMCGVPIRAVHRYIEQLVQAGQSVAVCDQITVPNKENRLVERKITEIITPGAITNGAYLDPGRFNFLALLASTEAGYSAVWADISTTKLYLRNFSEAFSLQDIAASLKTIDPGELILDTKSYKHFKEFKLPFVLHKAETWLFETSNAYDEICKHFNVAKLQGFGIHSKDLRIPIIAAFFRYIKRLELGECVHIQDLIVLDEQKRLMIDKKTLDQLQIFSDKNTLSLFTLLNRCDTPMGMRFLREALAQPLIQHEAIEHRQNGIAQCIADNEPRREFQALAHKIRDIPRILARLSVGKGNYAYVRDLYRSLEYALRANALFDVSFFEDSTPLDATTIETLLDLFHRALCMEEGADHQVQHNFDNQLDEQYRLHYDGRTFIQDYINKLAQTKGLESIKLGFNRVLGYFIELKNAKNGAVPTELILRQQLKGVFRYKTKALQTLENKILAADEQIAVLEQKILGMLIANTLQCRHAIALLSDRIAYIDYIVSLSLVAEQYGYCRPKMLHDTTITIRKGRHPLVEQAVQDSIFVPNDLSLGDDHFLHIITGPNMAGKSTYLRQNALIVLMAHIGSYVPAESAELQVCDGLYCRMGAADNILEGESTFLLEMLETAYILRHASAKSFVVFDEIGRGTSSLDGFAIAWAVVEYVASLCKARCLFATHFHDFAELEHPNVQFFTLRTRREAGTVHFFRKLSEGIIPHSFGIEVARMAGIREGILRIAQGKLEQLLEQKNQAPMASALQEEKLASSDVEDTLDGALQGYDWISTELDSIDPENITPLEALQFLSELKAGLHRFSQ